MFMLIACFTYNHNPGSLTDSSWTTLYVWKYTQFTLLCLQIQSLRIRQYRPHIGWKRWNQPNVVPFLSTMGLSPLRTRETRCSFLALNNTDCKWRVIYVDASSVTKLYSSNSLYFPKLIFASILSEVDYWDAYIDKSVRPFTMNHEYQNRCRGWARWG
jgi:hypothetical protein